MLMVRRDVLFRTASILPAIRHRIHTRVYRLEDMPHNLYHPRERGISRIHLGEKMKKTKMGRKAK
jgi:hypothetical protein